MGNIALPNDNHAELYVNEGRVNVNNNWDDNSNDNVYLGAARNFLQSVRTTLSNNRERVVLFLYIEDQVLYSLPKCVAVCLRDDTAQTVEGAVEIVCTAQNGDIKSISPSVCIHLHIAVKLIFSILISVLFTLESLLARKTLR